MVAFCIGTLAGVLAIAVGIVTLVAACRATPDLDGVARGLAALGAVYALLPCSWGVWELISSMLGIAMIRTNPVAMLIWLGSGIADLGVGTALLVTAVLAAVGTFAPARAESTRQWRRRVAPLLVAVGVLEIVMSAVYFLF